MNYCDLLYFADSAIGPVTQKLMRPFLNNELVFIKSGHGRIFFENASMDISPNQIFIVFPHTVHRIECDCKIEYTCIGFKSSNFSYPQPILAIDGGILSVAKLIEIIRNEFESKNHYRKDIMNLLLSTALLMSGRLAGFSEEKEELEKDNFNFIINYMDAKSHSGIDIEKAAKMSGLSYHRFRHRFKELAGISPQQYIIKQRIDFAKKMLENTTYKISSIALMCGFHSVPQFITCFNRQEGQTPVKYRRQFLCKKSNNV